MRESTDNRSTQPDLIPTTGSGGFTDGGREVLVTTAVRERRSGAMMVVVVVSEPPEMVVPRDLGFWSLSLSDMHLLSLLLHLSDLHLHGFWFVSAYPDLGLLNGFGHTRTWIWI